MTTDPASGATPGPDAAGSASSRSGAGADGAPRHDAGSDDGSRPHVGAAGAGGPGWAPGQESPLDRVFATLHRSPVQRLRGRRVIGGVASGVAQHFGFDPVAVRVGFVVLAMLAGFGLNLYLLAWLLLPDDQGSVHLERAVRARDKGSIALGVITAISLLDDPDGGRGWWPTVASIATAALVAFVVHRMHRRGGPPCGLGYDPAGPAGSNSGVPGAGGTAPGTPATRPGALGGQVGGQVGGHAGAHGSPTRGGDTSVFDPITGRWVPAVAQSQSPSSYAPSSYAPSSYAPSSYAPGGDAPTTPPVPDSEWTRSGGSVGATWQPAPPRGAQPSNAGWAGPHGYAADGDAPRQRRPRLGVTATLLTLLATAAVGVGAAWGVQAAALSADASIVGVGAALGFVSIVVFALGMRGVRATVLAITVLLLVPLAAGVARIAPAPGSQTGLTIQVGPR